MTEIKPFKAFIYNQEKIKDLKNVVCPPYDVISPAQQQFFLDCHPHNLIHILLGKDVSGEDKYKKAGNDFKNWIDSQVLIQDKSPAVYFYCQQYNLKGEKKTRLGFIALLKLEDKNSGTFKHEHTRVEPKEDRLKLIRQVKANLSPIFVIFGDHKRVIQRMYQKYIQNKKPFIEVTDTDSINHKIWRIDEPDVLEKIQSLMRDENIFIADGHHRYEVASLYREEMREKNLEPATEDNFNYVLAYFTNTDNRGLTILPINRLVKLDVNFDMEKFKLALSVYFAIEEVKDKTKFFFLMQKAGNTEHVIGMYRNKKFWLLRLKNVKILDKIIIDKHKDCRSLDVSILNYLILKRILGMDIEDKVNIEYSHNNDELIEKADKNNLAIAIFLNPARIEQIMAVALSGEKMPSKSTFFYPKVLSGLVINKF